MNKPINTKYFIIPVLYAAVIALLFILQFSGKSGLSETVGELTITGTSRSGGSGGTWQVEQVTVAHPAVTFNFSRDESIRVQTELGRSVTAGIRECTIDDDAAVLQFAEGITVRFSLQASGGIRITPELENYSGIESLIIPYSPNEQAGIETPARIPVMKIGTDRGAYFLSLSRNGGIDREEDALVFTYSGEGSAAAAVEPAADSGEDPYVYWFSRRQDLPSAEEYAAALDAYRDSAYAGWTAARYETETGWLYPSGETGFVEETFLSAASEAVLRSDTEAFDSFVRTAETNSGQLSYRSAVYTGDLREAFADMQAEDRNELQEITEAVRAGGAEVFRREGLLQFIIDKGPYSLLPALYEAAGKIDPETVDAVTAIDLLSVYIEARRLFEEVPPQILEFRKSAELSIYPAVITAESGLFLETEPGFSETVHSLRAGRVLLALGTEENDEIAAAVGRGLVLAQLSGADESGSVTGGYRIDGSAVLPGSLPLMPAENVYSALLPDRGFPRRTSLNGSLGPGSWTFTGAPVTDYRADQNSLEIQFTFPAGRSHYCIIQGIEDFAEIRLHDLAWRNDPQFEIYSTGYVYDGGENTLFIKLGHREDEPAESVIITY